MPKQDRRGSTKKIQPLTDEEQRKYDDFFRSEFNHLMRHVILLGATPEEAKDAAQSALIDLLQNWYTVQAPRPWCRKAAARHFLRSDIRESRADRSARSDFLARHGSDDSYSLCSTLEEWEFIIHFVENYLSGIQRQVMAWTIDGFEPQEIAKQLGKAPATVRSNLRHARKKLAAALREEYPELARSTGDAEGKLK
ncbi:sigma-70 family RNA polymerase sigma factor [Streptomyces gilvifuscus]|uniref:Sigma-70 family RNA polymerase sigma factor n=1 Tax=Streptomyces gilvifuscus TaxID=1550617 RepID=A0ABT5G6E3_9ACTN|nr:sigma-70 family RNA polymerase sigma factor [Streptomyces gilvifuscus]MDC2960441.1 sigma-70 family RNA polymerase sigma factor [Streptomyces gilvifuscus]